MGASVRARHRWRALVIAALPCALLVTTTANAAPPTTDPPPPGRGSLVADTPASSTPPSTTPPSTSSPSTAPPVSSAPPTSAAPESTTPPPASAAPATSRGDLSLAEVPTATGQIEGTKAPTSRLAETDPTLLGRTDTTPLPVMIKLDYDSLATYSGTVSGLDATSPQVTGRSLDRASTAERRYEGYIADREATFSSALSKVVPSAHISQSLRTVYGGVAAQIPANSVAAVLDIPGVVAVQSDTLEHPQTDASAEFIGATSLYPSLGGKRNAGKGVIVGVLDTGLWPEHPAFADKGNLARPPATDDGHARDCDFGDNPLTPANDPFQCNNKLISGQPFLKTYLQIQGAKSERYTTARDSDGHGTHTSSTAAGDVESSAKVFGVERGPIAGIAPGAWVSMYKVCGLQGCYSSDTSAAVQQAIYDGVNVINFSISGGATPATDATELAFLDAYAAGVFVAASAGNSGPAAGTSEHLSPWVTTVAASTQAREFVSTLTLKAANGDTRTIDGASIMGGVSTPTPIVLASAAPYSAELCDKEPAAGVFTGKIVICKRGGNGRVDKGLKVSHGGAAGMILYNPTLQDVETDNHWLPAIHLAVGTDLLAFLSSHTGVTATFTAGRKVIDPKAGDIMAGFSSRGPGGLFIKPDVTAPGVQILAGHTPTPDNTDVGPPGQYFQAIAGTSMSSPHVAGSAALLKALHRDWTPGQIKSALMTTGIQDVVKQDGATPADPFDFGSGRIELAGAGNPGLTFDASASDMATFGMDPVTAVQLNVPSIDIPTLSGRVETTRTAKNVSGKRARYDVVTWAPQGSTISVSPTTLDLGSGQEGVMHITVSTTRTQPVQQFGEIRLVPRGGPLPTLHIPVAFVPHQGSVSLTQSCDPPSMAKGATTTCTVTATNDGYAPATVDVTSYGDDKLRITDADGAGLVGGRWGVKRATLPGITPGVPALEPLGFDGFAPLAAFGVTPTAVGDESITNYDVPSFVYAGVPYSSIGVDSNGYLVVGGGSSEDNDCCDNVRLPDPARPNNVLAPFWTDLNGTGAPGISTAVLRDNVTGDRWFVVEWQVFVFGTTSLRTFQTWIGLNGVEDISFSYPPDALPTDPAGLPFAVGAENVDGSGGDALAPGVLPTEDLRVVSSDPLPGGDVSYDLTVEGVKVGTGVLTSELTSPQLVGTTVVTSKVIVTRR
jgi:Subtilase family/Fibronectin type-III domain/PA domain